MISLMRNIVDQIKNIFYFDSRSLALARICLALTVLIDLVIRFTDLEAHYTDFGVLPRKALLELSWEEWFISIHLLSGNYYIQLLLFIISAFFAFSMLIGFKTKLSTAVTWFLLISLHNRNPIVLQGGDVLLRCLLLWGIFIPWGETLSVDSSRADAERNTPGNDIFSPGAFAFLVQISVMYICTALLKSGDAWVKDYSAIYYALSLDQFRILLGNLLYSYPVLMKSLTFVTYWVELLGTALFFIPVKTGHFRVLGFIIFALLQTGLLLTMRVGLFPVIAISSLFIIIPGWVWERSGRLQKRLDTIFFGIYELLSNTGLIRKSGINNISPVKHDHMIPSAIVILLMLFGIYWNLSTATNLYGLNKNTLWLGHLLRVDQKWDMFAPSPFTDDGWFVIPGRLRNGKKVDVFREGNPVSWDKPDDAISDYKNYRWRKYMRRLWLRRYSDHRLYYGKYLCRKWNREHDFKNNLLTFDIYFMKERTLPNYKEEETEKVHIWQHRCF